MQNWYDPVGALGGGGNDSPIMLPVNVIVPRRVPPPVPLTIRAPPEAPLLMATLEPVTETAPELKTTSEVPGSGDSIFVVPDNVHVLTDGLVVDAVIVPEPVAPGGEMVRVLKVMVLDGSVVTLLRASIVDEATKTAAVEVPVQGLG